MRLKAIRLAYFMIICFYFNSTLVRLKVPNSFGTSDSGSYFNSTLVRLKAFLRQLHLYQFGYFNSTLVRLKDQWDGSLNDEGVIFQFNSCAIKGPSFHGLRKRIKVFQFNSCAIKGITARKGIKQIE